MASLESIAIRHEAAAAAHAAELAATLAAVAALEALAGLSPGAPPPADAPHLRANRPRTTHDNSARYAAVVDLVEHGTAELASIRARLERIAPAAEQWLHVLAGAPLPGSAPAPAE